MDEAVTGRRSVLAPPPLDVAVGSAVHGRATGVDGAAEEEDLGPEATGVT